MSAAFLAEDWCVPVRGVWFRGMEYTVPQFTKTQVEPTAVLYAPLVRPKRAFCPWAVLPPGNLSSGAGLTAWANWRISHV